MILAGLTLLAIGGADLIRQFQSARRRGAAYGIGALVFFVASIVIDAAAWAIGALLVAAVWVLLVRPDGRGRSGLWPIGVLAVACAAAVVVAGPRTATAALGPLWMLPAPGSTSGGTIPLDLVVLVLGAAVFLLESANTVVRTALRAERADPPAVADGGGITGPDSEAAPRMHDVAPATLKGGRLIGPLERVIVFALMLAGAYTLIAAVFAAKGIVRFPEISRDGAGDRAEQFLVGSLVSWVIALAAAFLVWWGAR
ncbi:MAG: hypothetical protein EOO67_06310 [Microbacterium sp.]|nr:MAG: hypothetical protein EOO67_06310 [Microbacterium sp.]